MRLSWPFNVFQRKPATEPATERAAGASAAAASPGPAVPAAPVVDAARRPGGRNEWRQLPALAETIGPPPLVAPNAPFAADLGAGTPPPPALKPLAHGRGLDAPAGIVVGLARPVQRAADSATRPLVQRRPAMVAATIADTPSERVDEAHAAPSAEAPPAVAPVTVAPARPRANLARLTGRDEATLPLPGPGLVGQPTAGPRSTPVAARAPVQPSPAPVAPAKPAPPDGLVSRKPADGPGDPDMPVRTRPTLGQSRRLGLGAPMTTAPPTSMPLTTAAADTTTAPPAAPAAPAPPTPDARAPLPAAVTPELPALHQHEAVQRRPAETPAPREFARPRRAAADVAGSKAASPAAAAPPAAAASPAPPRPAPSAPLVSSRPIGPRVQRAPLTGARNVQRRARSETDEALPAAAQQPVRIHRGANAAEMAQSLEAKAFTHNGEVYLPPSAGPMGSASARSLLAHELTHVAQQRTYGSRLPGETSALGQRLEQAAVAAERRGQLPLAMPPEQSGAESSRPTADTAATAQRRPATRGSGNDETTTISFPGTQRAPATTRQTDVSAESVGPRREPHRPTERELEELASQLYGRISRRLRRELLVDRERAGLMVDLR